MHLVIIEGNRCLEFLRTGVIHIEADILDGRKGTAYDGGILQDCHIGCHIILTLIQNGVCGFHPIQSVVAADFQRISAHTYQILICRCDSFKALSLQVSGHQGAGIILGHALVGHGEAAALFLAQIQIDGVYAFFIGC